MPLAIRHVAAISILFDSQTANGSTMLPGIGPQGIGPRTFDAQAWRDASRVTGEAPGRGASLFLDAGDGREWVLRPYRRGGLVARLSATRYLWTGLERTRAFRELRLTAALHECGLPVPTPVAAAVTRHGLTYEAALITERIAGARALADRLETRRASEALLEAVGRTIRRFHDAGLDHVDLNARNLLVDAQERIWLIDLDRCRLRRDGAWKAANLTRLERSLVKCGALDAMAPIRRGYAEG